MLMLLWLVVCSSSFNIFLSKELNAIFMVENSLLYLFLGSIKVLDAPELWRICWLYQPKTPLPSEELNTLASMAIYEVHSWTICIRSKPNN
jgi:hypothetical protein